MFINVVKKKENRKEKGDGDDMWCNHNVLN